LVDASAPLPPDLKQFLVDPKLLFEYAVWDLRQRLQHPLPNILWHYTSGPGLIGIVETATLWATQVSCLNDQSEIMHAAGLLREQFDRRLQENLDDEADRYFFARAIESLTPNLSLTSDLYIASFSEKEDNLGQWRAYGGGEGGYVVGFNPQGIQFGLETGHFVLPVVYDRETQRQIMSDLAGEAHRLYREGMEYSGADPHDYIVNTVMPQIRESLSWIGPFFKHEAFEAEREWRVAWRFTAGEESKLKFRQAKNLLARYLPLDFQRVGSVRSDKLPIVSVGVGPCRFPGVSINSVEALMKSKEYPVETTWLARLQTDGFPMDRVSIWDSRIPYQSP